MPAPALPPVRRQVVVPGPAETAFDVLADDVGAWWPLAEFGVHGGDATVAFSDGRLVERAADGREAVWGTVLEWERPRRLRVTWHPGGDPAVATEVSVTFTPVSDARTLVTLEHHGWERLADPAGMRAEYEQGWPAVLSAYAEHVASGEPVADEEDGPVWLALLHTPGPALAPEQSVFAHPGFAEHLSFLRRARERGVLVAAGPLGDDGDGMTVLRVAEPVDAAEWARLAQDDDQSVAHGVMQVVIRPWLVALTG